MLERNTRLEWIALAVLLAVFIGVLFANGAIPTHGEICEQAKGTGRENCATYNMALFFWLQIGKFFDDHGGAVSAISTIVIAVFTWRLWYSTDKLWREAQENRSLTALSVNAAGVSANAASRLAKATERQLRAYIGVHTGVVILQDEMKAQPFVVLPDCINDGQTPAYEMSYNARVDILPYPLPDDFGFPMKPEQAAVTSTAVVGPHKPYQLGAKLDRFCDADELNRIGYGKSERLYIYGTVRYKDAFGEQRWTNFSQSYQWRSDGTPLGENTKHHNDAT